MADIKDTEIEQFLQALASQSATPGGGSAAAIIGAMGTSVACLSAAWIAWSRLALSASVSLGMP